ncbi:hypothetical protein QZH41_007163 [Actinostola sp. cb2023]|nr:hypothetical protein QZH41_007163 [Actinostola sp. cb2023]
MNASNITSNRTKPSQPKMLVWYWSVRAVIAILTVFGNGLVMVLVVKSRRLRVIPNVFIFALALADFFVGAVITPTDFACGYWLPKSCDMLTRRLIFDILIHLSVSNLCALTFDRYMAVVQPLKYQTVMTKGQVTCILVMTWIVAAILPVTGYICVMEKLTLAVKILRVIDMVFLQIVPPLLLAIAYLRIVYIARRHEKTVRIQHSQLSFNYGHDRFLVKKRRSRKGESRERASVKMIGAVIIAFLLCYVLAIFRSLYFYIMNKTIPETVTHVSRILLLTNSAINFLVYAFLKKDFRQELRRIYKQTRIFKESFTFHDLLSKDSIVVNSH